MSIIISQEEFYLLLACSAGRDQSFSQESILFYFITGGKEGTVNVKVNVARDGPWEIS